MSQAVVLKVPEPSGDCRLDIFVSSSVGDMSRSRAQHMIERGLVLVDSSVAARPSLKLRPGQEITVLPAEPEPSELTHWDFPLSVTYEDDDILVVDKPAGMPVHPGHGHWGDTLANALLARWPEVREVGQTLRPGIVHRLDADTSGLIVIARTGRAHAELSRQFAERLVEKTYLALVIGSPRLAEAVIDAPIARGPGHRKKMAIVATGRPSTTHYCVRRRFKRSSLLQVAPRTGRTHQIRVHLHSIGHPVIGDALYGTADPALGRHFLHASALAFAHPAGGRRIELASPLPGDLAGYIEREPCLGGAADSG